MGGSLHISKYQFRSIYYLFFFFFFGVSSSLSDDEEDEELELESESELEEDDEEELELDELELDFRFSSDLEQRNYDFEATKRVLNSPELFLFLLHFESFVELLRPRIALQIFSLIFALVSPMAEIQTLLASRGRRRRILVPN